MFKRGNHTFLMLILNLITATIVTGIFILLSWGISQLRYIIGIENNFIVLTMKFVSILLAFMGLILLIALHFKFFVITIKYIIVATSNSFTHGFWRNGKKVEKFAVSLSWWIPRRYREDIIGDILEDCTEMRDNSCAEWRLLIQVIWQWSIAVVNLIPSAVIGKIIRILNPPN